MKNIAFELEVKYYGFRNELNKNNENIEKQLIFKIFETLNNESLKFIKEKSTFNNEFTRKIMKFELDVESFCKYLMEE